MEQSPLDMLAELEAKRAIDPRYQAYRAGWREIHRKDALKEFWKMFTLYAVFQTVLSVMWGGEIACFVSLPIDSITTEVQVHQFGIWLFAIGLLINAALARLLTRSTYK